VAHPRWGAPIVDHYDRILPGEGHRVVHVWDLVEFRASGKGPQDNEILHDAVVLEHVWFGQATSWSLLK
jgi:hypothetical protein